MKGNILLLAGCLTFMLACDKMAVDNSIPASDYYPLQTGKYIIYDIDSITFSSITGTDTAQWEIKEQITDTFYDLNNELNFRIERSRRENDTSAWLLTDIWSVRNKNGTIEKEENNLRFVKLATPVLLNKSWDGTVYLGDLDSLPVLIGCNNLSFLENWDYTYSETDSSATFNGIYFDNIITVKQQGADNLLELSYAIEVYAKNIGLVHKEFYHYTSQNTADIPWEDKVQCGYKYEMTILEYN